MSLLRDVVAALEVEAVPHALIGAAAMAVHGVSRATADVDFLTVNANALRTDVWASFESRGVDVRVLKGDHEDPLAGCVRLSADGERSVDLVVGRHAWQAKIVESAPRVSIGEITVKVARPSDLVLLKLYAGGPKDAWDVCALLESHERAEAIRAEVDEKVALLPPDCLTLWKRLRPSP